MSTLLPSFDPDELDADALDAPRAPARRPSTLRSVPGGANRTPPPRSSTPRPATENFAPRNGTTRSTSVRSPKPALPAATKTPPRALPYEVAGVVCLAVGVLLLYNALREQAEGLLPQVGIHALRWTFGIGAVVLPALLCVLGVLLIARRHHTNLRAFTRGVVVGFLVLLTAVHLAVPQGQEFADPLLFSHGGMTGGALAWGLRRAVGDIGAIIVLIALFLVSLLFFTEMSLADSAARAGRFFRRGARRVRSARRGHPDQYDTLPDTPRDDAVPPVREMPVPNRRRRRSPFFPFPQRLTERARDAAREDEPVLLTPDAVADVKPDVAPAVKPEIAPHIEIINTPPPVSVVEPETVPPAVVETPIPPKSPEEMTPVEALEAQALATATGGETTLVKKLRPQLPRRRFGDGPLMPEYFDDAVRALDPPLLQDVIGVEEDIRKGVENVQETLASFKIDAHVTDVKRGPVITRYEVKPAPGVRVASIASLDRDLARALSAIAVRIEAPVPGRNVIGIEVPNKRVHLVRLRDVLELPEFLGSPSKLAFVLGKDIAGQPKWADLTKMPHLLIAGATNSGKSVCLNSIIASILVRATPEEVKFSLIDPKRVELTLFRGIPHLYHPVVVEPKDAVRALRGAIIEMDHRYRMFAQRGVRNITSYNSKLEEGEAPLPYIVIVIDELADLMMTAAAEFEKLICRLAQLARATGIHLIVATQRPSVNIITGVIKANIPARIAFAVASQVDSRTILDAVGAERLIGSGDMLFDSNNGGKATRIQGTYLSEEEVNRVVEVLKNHYADEPVEYGLNLEEVEEPGLSFADDEDGIVEEKRDELYDEIKEFVLTKEEMSASMIQRKFEIGYPRAGRIVDQLERDGILSPGNGPKPRKVIGTGR
ncbi:MAG: DNA translocase FtsK [Armatimonadota bacterium]|nr:DNA translocase FtsK [Armatimonadota bacterium]